MMSYIEEIVTGFDKAYQKGKGTKSSDAPKNIFVLNEDCKKLDQEKVAEFQNLVANTLYATKRAIPDTYTYIEFLKTMVRAPNEENCVKLLYLM